MKIPSEGSVVVPSSGEVSATLGNLSTKVWEPGEPQEEQTSRILHLKALSWLGQLGALPSELLLWLLGLIRAGFALPRQDRAWSSERGRGTGPRGPRCRFQSLPAPRHVCHFPLEPAGRVMRLD